MGTAQLQSLLAPPSPSISRSSAQQLLAGAVGPSPIVPSTLASLLSHLLDSQRTEQSRLAVELARSQQETDRLLQDTTNKLSTVKHRTEALKQGHAELRARLKHASEALVSRLDAPVEEEGEAYRATLRERLMTLSQRRKELEGAKKWFGVIVKAEELGITVLRSLDAGALPQAFRAYVGLVDYIKLVYRETDQLKAGEAAVNGGASLVALTTHLIGMANSVWNSLVKALSSRLLAQLETLGWPQPFAEPLDPYEDHRVAEFQTAFVDLLTLEHLQNNNPLPGPSKTPQSKKPKPLLALIPLVHPLLLRFKWQFDGDRSTNRIDKPEYPLSHVLNLLTAHERFLGEDIQYLLDSNGFEDVDAVNEFTSLLLPPLASRLRHHLPQLLSMPPVLAHTVYQVVEFDQVLRGRGYRPRINQGQEEQEEEGEWEGLAEVVLGRREWGERWLEGERGFFDKRYFDAIGANDAWHIIPEEDYDAGEGGSGTRPTNSALRVKELAEQLADRYRPLPLRHTLPFLLTLHLPLLQSYATRITSSLDAFESLSFGLLPGALGQTTAATAGVGGVVRLVRAGVSARWMAERCDEWGEDAFFLHLYEYLAASSSSGRIDDPDLQAAAEDVLDNSDGTLFDREKKTFEDLADRSEDLIVRHCVREVVSELKPYFGKRFDLPSDAETTTDLSLSPELLSPLSLLSSLLRTLVASYPLSTLTALYRRISTSLSQALYDRLLVSHSWTEPGASQFQYDLEHGFLAAGREGGIQRGLARGWEVARAGARVLGLPTQASQQGAYVPGGEWTFSKVMQVVWEEEDDGEGSRFAAVMDELGVGEALGRAEVQALMRRRPECWR
ncbi:hypothetical protein JCM21900_004406 [Sporobolomyces salmonicolor]